MTLEPVGEYDSEAIDVAKDIITQRVDSLGIAEPEIIRQGDTIVVNLPGVKDQEQALALVGRTGNVLLRPVLSATPNVQTRADGLVGAAGHVGAERRRRCHHADHRRGDDGDDGRRRGRAVAASRWRARPWPPQPQRPTRPSPPQPPRGRARPTRPSPRRRPHLDATTAPPTTAVEDPTATVTVPDVDGVLAVHARTGRCHR